MTKIKILSDLVANKIAAGEVVERPASVVKELIENSIDAGADTITVIIEAGGRRLISISDNGFGMSRDDALLSLERHATSKIQDMNDIENIVTLGFRGEALPSIVSVSRAVIETRVSDEDFGTRLIIDGGILKNVTDVGRDTGTVIEIKNLFFNLPARRKFMKSDETEIRHIKRVIYDCAVSRPDISINLVSDGKEVFTYRKCSDREEMLHQIFGDTFAGMMVPLSGEAEGVVIEGYIGKPETASTSYNQFIIVNGRPVNSKTIVRSVVDGYGRRLVRGTYPPFVLYFKANPKMIDVNIHPSKREIKIHREYLILQELSIMVEKALNTFGAAPEVGERQYFFGNSSRKSSPAMLYNPQEGSGIKEADSDFQQNSGSEHLSQTTLFGMETYESLPEARSYPVHQYEGPLFIQLDNRYIITTIKESAIIVDQHVAHERILFEEILENMKGTPPSAQQLLFPVVVDFSAADWDILNPMLPVLNKIGFSIREFGDRTIIIEAAPSGYAGVGNGGIIYEFIEEMRRFGNVTSGYIEKAATAIACRAAIKSGKPMNQSEMQYLMDRLFATKAPFACPHGRPVVVKLTVEELDKRFGR